MSKRLLIIRHAEAAPAPSSLKDFDRHLTDNGLIQAAKLGHFLLDEQIIPQVIVSSKAVRASDTAQLLAEQLHLDESVIHPHDTLYNISMGGLIRLVNDLPDEWEFPALVGHNPTLSYFVEYLTNTNGFYLEPCAAVVVELDVAQWAEVTENSGQVVWRRG